jgi:hypothetical protein
MHALLGNDRETNNETTAVARQRPPRNNGNTVGGGAFYVGRSEAKSRERLSSVELVGISVCADDTNINVRSNRIDYSS